MTVNTIGMLEYHDHIDPFLVLNKVQKALNNLIIPERNQKMKEQGFQTAFQLKGYHPCDISLNLGYHSNMALINFEFRGEKRSMTIHFNCHSDYREVVPGKKIIFSLGCSGESDLFMKTALEPLNELGYCWFIHNDCEDRSNFEILSFRN